jgi:proline iminopeptidase
MQSHDLYPPIEPHEQGVLPVSDGHRIAYEVCGAPGGRPALVVHGGPGAGCVPDQRRFFDPAVYRIVLFDQRGAGRSEPLACLEHNTTADLIADIEALRRHLQIDGWLVFGGSWGSTLALAYAAARPEACRALVLRGIWLCRPEDLQWWFYGLRSVYPDHWQAFASFIPASERHDLLAAYYARLVHPDAAIHLPAAAAFRSYELRCEKLITDDQVEAPPDRRTLAAARIEAHYMRNAVFLPPDFLRASVGKFRNTPAAILHGRYDMLCPLEGAYALADVWPEADFEIVPAAGHSAYEVGTRRGLVAATNRFRARPART